MITRLFVPSVALAMAASLFSLVGCGSSSQGGGGPGTPDGGTPPNPDGGGGPPPDASTVIPGVDGGSAKGTQLAKGAVFVDGVTDDGHILYDDSTNIFTVPVAGGTPQMIAAFNPAMGDRGGAGGNVGIIGTKIAMTGIGTLSIWTAAHGLQVLSTTSVIGRGAIGISKDGSQVAYFDGASATSATANLMIIGTDGTGKKQLAAGVQFLQNCPPQITFAGAYVLASYCTNASPDASTPQAQVATWAAGSTTPVQLATGALGFAADSSGTHVLVSTAAGITVYPVGGGTGTLIDAQGTFGGFTKDGTSVLYTSKMNELKRSTVASPAPVTLLTSGNAQSLDAVSPDESFAMVSKGQDMTSGNIDIYLASAKTPGTATGLDTMQTANLFGDAFTADSSHALYLSNITVSQTTGDAWGTLNAAATAGGAPAAVTNATAAYVSIAGTKVLVATNYVDNNSGGTADLAVVDVGAAGTPNVIANQADGFFLVTSDLKNVVYTTSTQTGQNQGLWVDALQ